MSARKSSRNPAAKPKAPKSPPPSRRSRPPALRARGRPQPPARARASKGKAPPDRAPKQPLTFDQAIARLRKKLARVDDLTPAEIKERKLLLLERMFAGDPHHVALALAGLHWRDVRWWIAKNDSRYDEEFHTAYEQAHECMEEVRRFRLMHYADVRAMEGWDEPVFCHGVVVGHVRKFSEGLLALQLKAAYPERYATRAEISGPGGKPIEQKITGMPPSFDSPDEWAAAYEKMMKTAGPPKPPLKKRS
jgi:hypothetical protein